MAMSISPAQTNLAALTTDSLASTAAAASSSLNRASTNAPTQSAEQNQAQAPAAPPAPQINTDLRIDNSHQEYYEFVDGQTGDVVFELPPEALRAIAESLNVPLLGNSVGLNLDVKS
jgi:hypothetical protein